MASTFVAPPATATIRRFRRRSTGRRNNTAGKFGLDSAAVDVEEVPKHLADRAQATDLVHIRWLNHSAGYERGAAVRRAYADQHEIAFTGERESLRDGLLFKQDAAVRRRVRHEGDGHDERLSARAVGQMVDDFVRIRRGSTGQASHERNELQIGRRLFRQNVDQGLRACGRTRRQSGALPPAQSRARGTQPRRRQAPSASSRPQSQRRRDIS